MLQFMGLQRGGHGWVTEQQQMYVRVYTLTIVSFKHERQSNFAFANAK